MASDTAKRRVGRPVREPIPPWKLDLREFADMYQAMYSEVCERLRAYPDAHLRELVKARDLVSSTNCGWTTYRIAPLVAYEAAAILRSREKEPSDA